MNRRHVLCCCLLALCAVCSTTWAKRPGPPNIVVIFIDDMGYADIGPFGATGYKTPHLDRMAAEGRRFTDFVVSSAVCSASRSAPDDRVLPPAHWHHRGPGPPRPPTASTPRRSR